MKTNKRPVLFVGTLLLLILLSPSLILAQSQIRLWINGSYVNSDVAPVAENQRTLVPIRVISENLGNKVEWVPRDNSILISSPQGKSICLYIGKTTYMVDGKSLESDVAPRVFQDRTLVPIRLVAELFGQKVDWDQDNLTVIVGEGYRPPRVIKIYDPTPANPPQTIGIIDKNTIEVPASTVIVPVVSRPVESPTYVYNPSQGQGSGPIRGNKNTGIYHVPGGAYYDRISPQNIVYFQNEDDALAAGFRRSKV